MRYACAFFASLAFLSGAASSAAAQEGAAPVFSYVRSAKPEKGHAVLVRMMTYAVPITVTEKVLVNGQLTDVKRTEHRFQQREVDVVYDIGASRVINTDGKQLPIDEVWKRLKSDSVVAISGDFRAPSPAFLRALHPDTLVIIPPPPTGPMTPPSNKQPEVKPGDAP